MGEYKELVTGNKDEEETFQIVIEDVEDLNKETDLDTEEVETNKGKKEEKPSGKETTTVDDTEPSNKLFL